MQEWLDWMVLAYTPGKAAVEPLAGAAVSSKVSTEGFPSSSLVWLLTGLSSLLAGDCSVALRVGLCIECLNVPTKWQLTVPRGRNLREEREGA